MRFALFLDLADAGFRKPESRAESRTCAKPGHESESVRGAPRERRERGVPRRSPVGRGPRAVSSDATRVGGEVQAGEHFQNIQQARFCHMAVQSQILDSPCTFSDFEKGRVLFRMQPRRFRKQCRFRHLRVFLAWTVFVLKPGAARSGGPARYVKARHAPRALLSPRAKKPEDRSSIRRLRLRRTRRITRRVLWRRAPCAPAAAQSPPSPAARGLSRGSPARAPRIRASPRLAPSRARRARRRAL